MVCHGGMTLTKKMVITMNKKTIAISIIGLLIIAAAIYIYIDNSKITVENVKVVSKVNESNPTLYELSYDLNLDKHYDIIDCEYALLSEKGDYLGYGKTFLNNSKSGKIHINEYVSVTRNSKGELNSYTFNNSSDSNSYNFTDINEFPKPAKIQIRVYDQKFNINLKNDKGEFTQNPLFGKNFDIEF